MNGVQIHLALNHLPVSAAVFGTMMLAAGLVFGKEFLRRTGLVMLVLGAVVAPPAYLSGEPAEEIAENLAGVSEGAMETHEEAAGWAIGLTLAAGIAAAACLVFIARRGSVPILAYACVLIIGLLAVAALGRTAHLGGLIRHPELQMSGPG